MIILRSVVRNRFEKGCTRNLSLENNFQGKQELGSLRDLASLNKLFLRQNSAAAFMLFRVYIQYAGQALTISDF